MLIADLAIVASVAVLLFGGFLVWNSMRKGKPVATNASYELAVEAYEEAKAALDEETAKLARERSMLSDLNREMASALMMVSGHGACLSATEEHGLHVDADLDRRRAMAEVELRG